MPSMQQPPSEGGINGGGGSQYDFYTALNNVQSKLKDLSQAKAQAEPPPSGLRNALHFWRANKGNMAALITIYSITTATVVSAFFTERQKQVGTNLDLMGAFPSFLGTPEQQHADNVI